MAYLRHMGSNYPRRLSRRVVIEEAHGECYFRKRSKAKSGVITYLVGFRRDWIGLDASAYNTGILACHGFTFISRWGLSSAIY